MKYIYNNDKSFHSNTVGAISKFVISFNKSPNELWLGYVEFNDLERYILFTHGPDFTRDFHGFNSKIEFCGLKVRTNPDNHSDFEVMYNQYY